MSAILEIEKEQDNYAKIIASKLDKPISRKIGMIDILGITVFAKYLKKHGIKLNLSNSMHKFPFALEEYKITDVSHNGHTIYVSTVFKENYIRIPKAHFKLGIEPDYYVITEVHKSVEKGVVGGYIKAKDVKKCVYDDNFYYPQKSDVLKIEELIETIKTPNEPKQTHGRHLEASSMFVKLTDGELKKEGKDKLIRHLLTCESCRIKLNEVLQFDRVLRPEIGFSYNTDKLHRRNVSGAKLKASTTEQVIRPSVPTFIQEEINTEGASKTKETIDFIFKGKNVFDIDFGRINIPDFKAKKQILVAVTVAFVLLFTLAVGFGIKKSSQTLKPIAGLESVSPNEIDNEQDFYNSQDYYDSQDAVNLDYSLSNSNGAKPAVMSVKDISWEVDKDIAGKEEYTKFLQIVGKNIRLNLQNELLVATDFARNNTIRVNIKFSNSGKVGSLRMAQGSGSNQIDEIIQKCAYETLSYIKPPISGFMGKGLEMTLVIEL